MDNNNHEWLAASTIADTLDVTPSAVTYAERNGSMVGGRLVESRPVTQGDRDRLGLTGHTRRVYRLAEKTIAGLTPDEVEDLLADLAGCEVRIEDLEAQAARLKQSDSQANFSLQNANQMLEAQQSQIKQLSKEVEGWKMKAERAASAAWRAECDRDEAQERADRLERELNRGIVRRALRRVVEVVR